MQYKDPPVRKIPPQAGFCGIGNVGFSNISRQGIVGARHASPAWLQCLSGKFDAKARRDREKPSPGGRWHAKGVTDEGR